MLKKFMMDENDLNVAARSYGLEDFRQFQFIILEGDGKISGILHSQSSSLRASQSENV
jgi:uncharacterized membrane protein YcaP (DUF421 family)